MEPLLTGHTRVPGALHFYLASTESERRGIAGVSLCNREIPVPNTRVPWIGDDLNCSRCRRKAAKLGYIEFQDCLGDWFDLTADGTTTERNPVEFEFVPWPGYPTQ